jgi:hypothetical protein
MATANSFGFRLARLAIVGSITVGFLLVTSPVNLPAVLLIAPFAGIFVFLFLLVLEVFRFLGPDESAGEDARSAVVRIRRPRLMAAVIAGFPVLLLTLQSIVELTFWDIIIAATITVLAYLYLARSSVSFWRGPKNTSGPSLADDSRADNP